MLELKKITKIYETEGFKQKALDNVSVNFRVSEFASILGASGSGKTTLLNIIGGLDHYTSGDLIINETSTKEYNDRDWDTYRNHRVGFVFQSYNLIPHQTVLQNVELALTLSGVSKSERRKKAKAALKEVGLEHHINKKPNQLSGGQMQRVAIARALVNDPEILLADEPTGALDSETSVQIMNILSKVAQDRLVIMVTHNPELANEYSSRIIKLKDGKIIEDSNPYDGQVNTLEDEQIKSSKSKKTSMNLLTALSLSLNNLMTKKGRTILTAFAGSIGIIGIALILSLSNGVQEYIDRVEKETLSSYPITIESTSIDYTSLLGITDVESVECLENHICTTDDITSSYSSLQTSMYENNLTKFKEYLETNPNNLNDYVTDIQYSYDIDLQIYSKNSSDSLVRVSPEDLTYATTADYLYLSYIYNPFEELIASDSLLDSQYELLAGSMPSSYDELVLIVNEDNQISLSLLYSLDILDREELSDMLSEIASGNEVSIESINYSYDELVGTTYKLILNTDYYEKTNGIWVDMSDDEAYMNSLYENALELKIVGVARIKEDSVVATSDFVGYTHELVTYVINKINESDIAKEQLANESIDVFTGEKFTKNTYEDNLSLLGIVDLDSPSSINIYPKDFSSKEVIEDMISEYNTTVSEEDKITYTDLVGTLLSGVTTVVNVISYILIAFVAISLIVSSIMIAIITYISVLERTKEIGILRAIGASKKDVARVFNAETIIEGFISGVLGIVITLIICIPVNIIVKEIFNVSNIASLPLSGAIGLIIISVVLTVVAGLIPSKVASKKDPVESLRTE